MEMDLGAELGTTEAYSTQRLTLFVPNKDKNGRKLKDHDKWVKEARELLSKIGGGATAFPPADGTWAGDDGKIIWVQTTMIFCYILPDPFQARLPALREFLHRFGRETNQGEVVVEFDGGFYRIRQYDDATGKRS